MFWITNNSFFGGLELLTRTVVVMAILRKKGGKKSSIFCLL